MRDLVIVGAGGLAREIAFLVEEINRARPTFRILGFVDRDGARRGEALGRYTILGAEDDLPRTPVAFAIGVGTPALVRGIADRLQKRPGAEFPNLVHPGVVWDVERISVGVGNRICAGNVLTTDIAIGSFNLLNLNCTVGHDVHMGDHIVVNPNVSVSGGVRIEDECLVGTGAVLLQGVILGQGATLGAGAVLTKDGAAGETLVGIPARPLSRPEVR